MREEEEQSGLEKAFLGAAFTSAMRNFLMTYPRNTLDPTGNKWFGNITFLFHPDGKVRAVQEVCWGRHGRATLCHAVPQNLHEEFNRERVKLEELGFGIEDVE